MIKRLTLKRSSHNKQVYEDPPVPAKPPPATRDSGSHARDHARDHSNVVSERQVLSPDVLFELRKACAVILRETGPSDEDYATIINQPDPLEKYQKDQQQLRDLRDAASASQTSLPNLFHTASSRKRDSKHLREDARAANRSSQNGAPADRSSKSRKHDYAKELSRKPLPEAGSSANGDAAYAAEEPPLAPATTTQSGPKQPRKSASAGYGLDALRAQVSTRPKTTAAPALEHTDMPAERRRRDSRRIPAGVDEPAVANRASTGAARPAEQQGVERGNQRHSDRHNEQRREDVRRSRHDLMEQGAQREKRISAVNPDYTHVPTLHPTVFRQPQAQQPAREPERNRPQSRASNIIGNIREGIRDYVNPFPSMASTRFQSRMGSRAESRAESRSGSRSSSRPPSRGSFSATGRSWLKGAANGLRRKGSWSSFRSNYEDEDEKEKEGGRTKGPDLNRSLPPLPGLDQYKEPKIHIAHLLARGPDPAAIDTNMSATSLPNGAADSPTTQTGSSDVGPTPPSKNVLSSQADLPRSPLAANPTHNSFQQPSSEPMSGVPQSAASHASAPAMQQTTEARSGAEQPPQSQFPPRTSSAAALMLRMPFSNEESAAASRVVSSMDPGYIDLEVRRRLQGKISSPVSPVESAAASQRFPRGHTLAPPLEHEHPADATEVLRDMANAASDEEQADQPPSLPGKDTPKVQEFDEAHDERKDSVRSQTSAEARSGALGVDRRPQLMATASHSFSRAPEQQRRADSALGPSAAERVLLAGVSDGETARTGSRGTVETARSGATAGTAGTAAGGVAGETHSRGAGGGSVSSSQADRAEPARPRAVARDTAPVYSSRAREEIEWRRMRELVGGGALVGLEQDPERRRRARERERDMGGSRPRDDRGLAADRESERARAAAILGAQEPRSRPTASRRRTGSDLGFGDDGKPPRRSLRNRLSRLLSGGGGPEASQQKVLALPVN